MTIILEKKHVLNSPRFYFPDALKQLSKFLFK